MGSCVGEPPRGILFFQRTEEFCFSRSEIMTKIVFPFTMFHFGTLLAAYSLVKILWIGDDYE